MKSFKIKKMRNYMRKNILLVFGKIGKFSSVFEENWCKSFSSIFRYILRWFIQEILLAPKIPVWKHCDGHFCGKCKTSHSGDQCWQLYGHKMYKLESFQDLSSRFHLPSTYTNQLWFYIFPFLILVTQI